MWKFQSNSGFFTKDVRLSLTVSVISTIIMSVLLNRAIDLRDKIDWSKAVVTSERSSTMNLVPAGSLPPSKAESTDSP